MKKYIYLMAVMALTISSSFACDNALCTECGNAFSKSLKADMMDSGYLNRLETYIETANNCFSKNNCTASECGM